jgi:NADPH:quinone reductase-like Zn-dependent oxidoreductase
MDIAGVVEEVGADVTDLRVGDAVVAMLGSRFGGHAEYAIARQTDAIAHKPADLDFAEAVATVFGGITARAFFNQAALEPTSRVLVNGASGAVGSAAVQLAKAAGAHVTAVCSSDNTRMVSALGADRVIDYRVHDFAGEDSRYDIVMDCVGNAPASRVHPIIERGGALLHVAGDLRSMVGASRNRRKHNLRIVTEPGTYRSADLDYILELAETGGFRPVVDRTYTLDQITSAHRFVDSGRKRGNVVLTIAG